MNALLGQSPAGRLTRACSTVALLLWLAAACRHGLLQSGGFDLGIYDQVAWQMSRGLEPRSTLLGLHHLGNHGAWVFYAAALPYRLLPSLQWLLASQALALAFTAVPLWALARQAGLSPARCWSICLLWWLQPSVFNTNLFDFHPEVWAMPALAGAFWASRAGRQGLWLLALLLMLGCRDGLTLVVAGLGLSELLQRHWRRGTTALGLGLGWLLLLSQWLYPLLNANQQGPSALRRFSHLGESVPEILINAVLHPWQLAAALHPAESGLYLLLLALPAVVFWRLASLPALASGLPLALVNALSESAAQRDLVHHYNLPLAVIVVVAAVDGLAREPQSTWPLKRLALVGLCWALLAKPWFFLGPYGSRQAQSQELPALLKLIRPEDRVLTSNHFAPHLTHRRDIRLLRKRAQADLSDRDVVLLNPGDPGWSSTGALQRQVLKQARQLGWRCRLEPSGLSFCQRP